MCTWPGIADISAKTLGASHKLNIVETRGYVMAPLLSRRKDSGKQFMDALKPRTVTALRVKSRPGKVTPVPFWTRSAITNLPPGATNSQGPSNSLFGRVNVSKYESKSELHNARRISARDFAIPDVLIAIAGLTG